ncbi:MAG: acriflavin resistance protein [Proteobacteria bacterium SG_bin7]|nr:MAG: acriflavin resistance protein [Proteobacteria bacterium SG_bin7]
MTLSDLSIRRPVFAWMLMAALIVFGGISFGGLGLSQLPDVDFPVVGISIQYPGAAPEVIETDVVDIVEDAVMTIQGIRNVTSFSRYGMGTVSVEFELNRGIDVALQEIQTKIAQVQKKLPKEIEPPVITKTNPEDQPIMWLTLTSDKHSLREMMVYVRDQIKSQLATISGVGDLILGGYVEPNLRVWVSAKKLDIYNLTVEDILATIEGQHSELPAGEIETARKEMDVRTLGEARSIDEFSNIVISERGGRPNYTPIFLKQVASVENGLAEIRRISRFNGVQAVGMGIRKQRGSNAVEVARNVKAKIKFIQEMLPPGMKLQPVFDTTKFIEESVDELIFTLFLSAVLTALVCWLFLGSWSSTFNVVLAIPTSIVGAFMIIRLFGFTLNTFTLLGLSLAIGIVVDDAIMVLENIIRHLEMGKNKVKAAIEGANEITFAAMAATIAICAIFVPVAFMRGVIGAYFFQFGITMTGAVLLSLLEALTLTPMRCSQFVEIHERRSKIGMGMESAFNKTEKIYESVLSFVLNHRWSIVIASLVFFFASLFSNKFINKEFVPSQDQGRFMLNIKGPSDSSIRFTESKVKIAEEWLLKRPEVEATMISIGGFEGGQVNLATCFVTLKPMGQRSGKGDLAFGGKEPTQQMIMDYYRKELKIPEMKIFIQDLSMRGFSASRGYPIEFSIRGPEWDKLASIAQEYMKKLNATDLVSDVDTDYQLGKPELRILPNRDSAAMRGVDIHSISSTVNALIGGVVNGKYQVGGHRYDIRTRLEASERNNLDLLKELFVRNNRGELVKLANVVSIEEKVGLQQITRYNRERSVTVFANIKRGKSQADAMDAVHNLTKDTLPPGYHIVMGGSSQTFAESFKDLRFALILGIVVAYMVLASQFNSFLDPITVLVALPFSLTGAFLALLLSGQSLNIYSFIGLILLMGIVKKNSILLVDYTNQLREAGETDVRKALMKACPIRLRPILMTSFATIAGALPPALAWGPGAETRIPMAIAVIGGVLVSTVLTLVVVPCVFSLFADLRVWAASFSMQRSTAP